MLLRRGHTLGSGSYQENSAKSERGVHGKIIRASIIQEYSGGYGSIVGGYMAETNQV